jgi:hypothetical protein
MLHKGEEGEAGGGGRGLLQWCLYAVQDVCELSDL